MKNNLPVTITWIARFSILVFVAMYSFFKFVIVSPAQSDSPSFELLESPREISVYPSLYALGGTSALTSEIEAFVNRQDARSPGLMVHKWILDPPDFSDDSVDLGVGMLDALATRGSHIRGEHLNQLVSAMAEFGGNSRQVIVCGAESIQVEVLIARSISEFSLAQRELSWTASALLRYLKQPCWTNQLGEAFDFDVLAKELMARPLNSESCGGVHIVIALTEIFTAGQKLNWVKKETLNEINKYLGKLVDEFEAVYNYRAHAPFVWAPSRFSSKYALSGKDSLKGRLIIAGHLLLWFEKLPPILKPKAELQESLMRDSVFLANHFRPFVDLELICPLTHICSNLKEKQ